MTHAQNCISSAQSFPDKINLPFLHKNYWEKFDFKYIRLAAQDQLQVAETISKNSQQLGPFIQVSTPTSALKHRSLFHLRALATMVKVNKSTLLTHSISDAFLKVKWRIYGRWIQIMLIFFLSFCKFSFSYSFPL